jgi:uncharacterized protein (TIGR02996 family)
MTTEDDFQRALDAHPDDWQTRLVFADWLQDQRDPRADGMRALGTLALWPFEYGLSDRCSKVELWGYHNGEGHHQPARAPREPVPARHALPPDWLALLNRGDAKEVWCRALYSRREAEDAAALAFAGLPAERRAELLASPPRSAS